MPHPCFRTLVKLTPVVLPHPLIVIFVPAKVWVTSSGRQAIPTVLEIGAGVARRIRAKSLSSGLNFSNVLRTAFMLVEPKGIK